MELSAKLKEYLGEINIPTYANKKAKELVGERGSNNEGWLDKEDAARHLLGIGEMARVSHPIVAKGMGALYELLSGSDSEEDAKMDEHNNKLALSLFNASSRKELEERVKKMINESKKDDFSDPTKAVYLK